MKIFVAGATGAIGRTLVPLLLDRGHAVTGTTRSPDKADWLRAQGATAVVADGLDRDAMARAMQEGQPDTVVHQLTALGDVDFRRFERSFAQTNRLRMEGTDILLAGAREAGARRFVTQSFAGWPYGRSGKRVKTEDDQLDPQVPKQMRPALDAIRYMEDAVLGADGLDGLVLRYGGFYGPGTGLEPGGPHFEMVRKRRFPIVGDGGGVWSFIHIEDAAEATAAAITGGEPGVYNVVDDDPAPVSEWLPELAAALGAKPPRRLPLWVARLVGGEHFVALMTDVRGASNTKARRELGWNPRHATWREGFREVAG